MTLPPSPSPSPSPSLAEPPSHIISDHDYLDDTYPPQSQSSPPYTEQYIALTPTFIFTSNPTSPLVHVHRATATATSTAPDSATPLGIIPPPPKWSSPHRPDNVTAICADQHPAQLDDGAEGEAEGSRRRNLPARLGVFYQSGGFVVLRISIDDSRLQWSRESIHPPQSRPRTLKKRSKVFTPLEGDPIVLATLHYPVLITCTLAFHLSVYTLPTPSLDAQPSRPKHLSTLHSDVSFHPAALSLFPGEEAMSPASLASPPDDRSFRAALTYCTPLYPSSWTVAVQEINITLDPSNSSSSSDRGGEVVRGECIGVGKGDEHEPTTAWPRNLRPVVGVKGRAVGVGTDGRWCVLAGENNQIEVYALPTSSVPTSASHSSSSGAVGDSPSPPTPLVVTPPSRPSPILHSQTLVAPASVVTSVALSAGRCVSGGKDGRVLVWELNEGADEAEHDANLEATRMADGTMRRTVAHVEVKPGGRRPRPPRSQLDGAFSDDEATEGADNDLASQDEWWRRLPHPASISTAARSLFLPQPPGSGPGSTDRPPAIRQLTFDEEKIVGLVRVPKEGDGGGLEGDVEEVMKVWSFNS